MLIWFFYNFILGGFADFSHLDRLSIDLSHGIHEEHGLQFSNLHHNSVYGRGMVDHKTIAEKMPKSQARVSIAEDGTFIFYNIDFEHVNKICFYKLMRFTKLKPHHRNLISVSYFQFCVFEIFKIAHCPPIRAEISGESWPEDDPARLSVISKIDIDKLPQTIQERDEPVSSEESSVKSISTKFRQHFNPNNNYAQKNENIIQNQKQNIIQNQKSAAAAVRKIDGPGLQVIFVDAKQEERTVREFITETNWFEFDDVGNFGFQFCFPKSILIIKIEF